MINPFVENLDALTLPEVENKIVELQSKYFKTNNPQVQTQIANLLEIYKSEAQARRAHQSIQNQQNDKNDLDSLINIS